MSEDKFRVALKTVALNKLLLYLKSMKKHVIHIDEERGRITVSDSPPYMPDSKVNVNIIVLDNWIRIYILIMDEFDVELDNAKNLLYGLLRLQDDFTEFNFSISKSRELVTKADIFIPALTLDVFKEEYDGVLLAYANFVKKVLPKIREAESETLMNLADIW